LIGCEKDTIVVEKEIIDGDSDFYYKTPNKGDVLDFLNSKKAQKKSSFITSMSMTQLKMEPLVNTDQLIAVVPAITK
jgi:hypothetical protein